MKTKPFYTSPECEWELCKELEIICTSGNLDDLVDDTDTIEFVS